MYFPLKYSWCILFLGVLDSLKIIVSLHKEPSTGPKAPS